MKKSYIVAIIVIVVIAVAVGGYFWYINAYPPATSTGTSTYPNTSTNTSTNMAPQTTNTITISNYSFNPNSTTVPVGTTVTWMNNDSTTHTVTSDAFASPDIAPNSSYQHTFSAAGTYSYHCSIHPSMTGTVIVK